MACIASGLACLYAGLSESVAAVEKFLPAFNYLLLPVSGCFFMVEWLPAKVQELVLYIPLVHAFEAVRSGMFGPSVVTHFSLFYGFSSACFMAAVGMVLINWVRDRV